MPHLPERPVVPRRPPTVFVVCRLRAPQERPSATSRRTKLATVLTPDHRNPAGSRHHSTTTHLKGNSTMRNFYDEVPELKTLSDLRDGLERVKRPKTTAAPVAVQSWLESEIDAGNTPTGAAIVKQATAAIQSQEAHVLAENVLRSVRQNLEHQLRTASTS